MADRNEIFFITFDNFVVIYDVKIKLCNANFIVLEMRECSRVELRLE
jgi:hypothetical protein